MTYRYGQKGYTDSSSGIWTPYGPEESNADFVIDAVEQLLPMIQRLEQFSHFVSELPIEPYSASDNGHVAEQREAALRLSDAAEAARNARRTLVRISRSYEPGGLR